MRETIRYAGAPISLSLDESHYKHQAVALDFVDGRVAEIRSLPIPQVIEIVRIPARGAAPLGEVLGALDALPMRVRGGDGEWVEDLARPYLEVVVALDKPEPKLRSLVETALADKRARLVYLHVEHTGDGHALADGVHVARRLAELDPREVFGRMWARDHVEPPTPEVLAGFDRLLAEVHGDLVDPEIA
jgi:DNA repair protein SbcD/Mre11